MHWNIELDNLVGVGGWVFPGHCYVSDLTCRLWSSILWMGHRNLTVWYMCSICPFWSLVSDVFSSVSYPLFRGFRSRWKINWSWSVIEGPLFMLLFNHYNWVTLGVKVYYLLLIEVYLVEHNCVPHRGGFCVSLEGCHIMVKHWSFGILVEDRDWFWLIRLVSFQSDSGLFNLDVVWTFDVVVLDNINNSIVAPSVF